MESTDLNTNFNWWDDLVEDLLKALSNFKIVMEFQKDFSADKLRQCEKVRKKIVRINERYVEYLGPVSLPLFPSDMDGNEKNRCLHLTPPISRVMIVRHLNEFLLTDVTNML